QGVAPVRLELVEGAAIHQSGDDLALVEGPAEVGAHDAGDLRRIEQRRARRRRLVLEGLRIVQGGHHVAQPAKRGPLVRSNMVADAGFEGMQGGAAEIHAVNHLGDRRTDDLRSAQMDRGTAVDHHEFVAQGGNVSAAGGAFSEHHGKLRDAFGRHAALAIEGAAEMVLVVEHLFHLVEVRAAAIDQIEDRKPVLDGDFLSANMLLHRLAEKASAFHRGVIGDDHAGGATHRADAGDDAGTGQLAVIKAPGSQRRELEKGGAGVDQQVDAITHQQLLAGAMAFDHAFAAAGQRPVEPLVKLVDQSLVSVLPRAKAGVARINGTAQNSHYPSCVPDIGNVAAARKFPSLPRYSDFEADFISRVAVPSCTSSSFWLMTTKRRVTTPSPALVGRVDSVVTRA